MTKPSRNLWTVKMQHMDSEELFVLAPTVENASRKAITFCRRVDKIRNPIVLAVKFSGTIDVF
jgi:hypothetical protein